jgi:type IX secretion system substrate protein
MSRHLGILALLLVCGAAAPLAHAQTPPYPRGHDACSAGDGGVIVVWEDSRYGERNIYAQRMSPLGARVWPDTGVAVCAAAGHQIGPRVVADGIGGAYVVWQDYRTGTQRLYAQRIDATGAPQWATDGIPVATVGAGLQSGPLLSTDAAGGLLVTWTELRTTWYQAWTQRIDRSGALLWGPGGVSLTNASAHQMAGGVVTDNSGGAIAVWLMSDQIFVQRVDGTGAPQWGAGGVQVSASANVPIWPSIAPDGAGGAFVAWNTNYQTSYPYVQRVSSAGAPLWGADGVQLSNATNFQNSVVPMFDGPNGPVVTWGTNDGAKTAMTAQRVDLAGTPQWATNGVTLGSSSGTQGPQAMAHDAQDGAIVAWTDYRNPYPDGPDIFAQRIHSDGSLAWDPAGVPLCAATGAQSTPVLITDNVSGATGVWQDLRFGTSDSTLFAVHVDGLGHTAWPTGGVRVYYVAADLAGAGDGVAEALRLDPVWPNPSRGALNVSFALPRDTRATLELLDIAGRRVAMRQATTAGRNQASFGTTKPLRPGVYLVRLSAAGSTATRRACVLR